MLALKLGVLVPILFAAGCASSSPVRSLAVATNNPAAVERDLDGTVTLRSLQTHLVSVLPQGEKFSNNTYTLPSLYLVVANGGKENITLKPTDILAYTGEGRVTLLDPLALQERLDREQAAAGSRASFPISIRDASQPAELRQTHFDPTRSKVEPFNTLKFQVPARVIEQALQPQVIRPGDVGGGRITLEAQDILSGLPLKIVVNVAGEQHEFLFEVRY